MHRLRNRLLLGLGFGVLVMAGLAFWSDLAALRAVISHFRWEFFPIALGCTLFNYFLRFGKWHFYVRITGAKKIPAVESARLFVAGFPLSVTPGKVGEALKAWWLTERTGISFARTLPVVLAERFSDGLAVLLLSIFGVISFPALQPVFLLIVGGCAAVIVVLQIRPLAEWLLARARKLPLVGRQAGALADFYESGRVLLAPGPLLLAVAIGVVSWMGEGIGFYCILLGLGVPASLDALSSAVFALAFSTVVGSLSALPGGLGAAEASITGLLILSLGADRSLAGAATILIRLATLWFGVAFGLAVWALSPGLWRTGPGTAAGEKPALDLEEQHAVE